MSIGNSTIKNFFKKFSIYLGRFSILGIYIYEGIFFSNTNRKGRITENETKDQERDRNIA